MVTRRILMDRPGRGREVFNTPLGRIKLLWADGGILRLELPSAPPSEYSGELPRRNRDWDAILGLDKGSIRMEGNPTPFQLAVRSVVAAIPPGRTMSYGQVAVRAGFPGAARAVGAVMAANPVPLLLPCHRVIRSDGKAGGFSAGPGWKEFLLSRERGGG